MDTIVVIPTYNERENIAFLVGEVLRSNPWLKVLIVDDNSPDGTGDIADELAERFDRINVLHGKWREGLGRVYVRAFKWVLSNTESKYIVTMDADFSHDPKHINTFLERVESYDVVVGSRYVTGINVVNWPLRRLLFSCLANRYVKFITAMPIHDATSGFVCLRRNVIEAIDLDSIASDGFAFAVELKYKAYLNGARIMEEPIIFIERRDGQTKMSFGDILEASFIPWKLRLKSKASDVAFRGISEIST